MKPSKRGMLPFWLVLILFNMAASFVHPVTPTLIIERQLDSSLFGTALAAMTAVNFLFAPFWGRMCGYIPTKRIMSICGVGYALGQTIFGAATSSPMVIGGRMFAGIFTSGLYVAFSNYVVNVSEEADRGGNLTTMITIQSVTSAVGYFIGGFLGLISVEAAFAAQVFTLVGTSVLAHFLCLDDTPFKYKPDKPITLADANPFASFLAAKSFMTPMLALVFVMLALGGIGFNSFEQCFNYYIKDQFGMSSAYNGTFKAIIAVVIMATNSTVCAYLQKKTDINRSFAPVVGTIAALLTCVLLVDNRTFFVGSYIAFSALNSIRVALMQNMTASRANAQNSSAVMGFFQAMNSLGGIFGALFAGLIYAANPIYPFVLSAGAFLTATAVAVVYVTRYRGEKKA